MTSHLPPPLEPEAWRKRAEERLAGSGDPMGLGEAMRLVHELRVHQVELEMQNEALREARLEAETGWARFQELYDFAPVGYFTLDAAGLILQVNFAGARLLGSERNTLMNRRFAQFLKPSSRVAFAAFLQKGLGTLEPQTCEVFLPREGACELGVRLESSSEGEGKVLRMAAVDITQLRAAEGQVNLLNEELERRV